MYKKIAALVLAAALLCSCTAHVSVQRIPAELPRAEAPSATPTPERRPPLPRSSSATAALRC